MRVQPGLRAVNLQKAKLLDRLANSNPELAQQIRGTKLDWYLMKNQAGEEEGPAQVYIYEEIGGSFGIGAMDFIEQLNEITTDEIVIRINSPGGLLIEGVAIANALAQHPSKIITRVDGIAASAASIIAIAGDVCEMMIGSQMMIHDVIVNVQGNAAELREAVSWLEEQSENVANIYASKAGGDPQEWRALMKAETWMMADEAVAMKLADNVFVRDKGFAVDPPMPMEDPDEDEDEEKEEEEPSEDSASEDDEEKESDEDEAIDALMHRKHRLTNRGYKYLGRDKAPAPAIKNSVGYVDLLDAWR